MAIWIKKVATTPLTAVAKVIDSIQAQTNERQNAPSIHAVREALEDKWETIYPVGSIYMSVNNIDPSVVFGGTWQQIKDKFLLASGDTYENGATGGEATHTLTVSEIPSHNHGYDKATTADGPALTVAEMPVHRHLTNSYILSETPYTYGFEITFGESTTPKVYFDSYTYNDPNNPGSTLDAGSGAAHSHTVSTTDASTTYWGGSREHNNMPPYLAVNVWVRTA
jgi:microcystin-dependent protein